MGIYCEYIFPWLFEKMGDSPRELMGKMRIDTLKGVSGRVLDIGFGVGFNLPYYSKGVTEVVAIEPSEGMKRRAGNYIAKSSIPVNFIKETAESMSFSNGEFDSVVSTMTLCTVEDQTSSLKEILRVLKPKGRFYFLEHVAAPNKKDRKLQNLLNPINRTVFCGCNLNRETEKTIIEAGFKLESIEHFNPSVPGWPKFTSYMIRGIGGSSIGS